MDSIHPLRPLLRRRPRLPLLGRRARASAPSLLHGGRRAAPPVRGVQPGGPADALPPPVSGGGGGGGGESRGRTWGSSLHAEVPGFRRARDLRLSPTTAPLRGSDASALSVPADRPPPTPARHLLARSSMDDLGFCPAPADDERLRANHLAPPSSGSSLHVLEPMNLAVAAQPPRLPLAPPPSRDPSAPTASSSPLPPPGPPPHVADYLSTDQEGEDQEDYLTASIPDWIFDFMPSRGGYFIGNVSPARMDFRWFCLGNFIAILSSLATAKQAEAILDLVEERWEELIGEMPLKICYPAMENQEWQIVTGCDPRNTRWSYHNGGSWPVLLWLLVAVSVKQERLHMARRAVDLMERRLAKDNFPEYYDGLAGRYVGKQARKSQTWSIAGYLVANMLLDNPEKFGAVCLEDDGHITEPLLKRSASCTEARGRDTDSAGLTSF